MTHSIRLLAATTGVLVLGGVAFADDGAVDSLVSQHEDESEFAAAAEPFRDEQAGLVVTKLSRPTPGLRGWLGLPGRRVDAFEGFARPSGTRAAIV